MTDANAALSMRWLACAIAAILNAPENRRVQISPSEKLAALKRELRLRESVYKKKIADGRMTTEEARREYAVMLAIAKDYEAVIEILDASGVKPD